MKTSSLGAASGVHARKPSSVVHHRSTRPHARTTVRVWASTTQKDKTDKAKPVAPPAAPPSQHHADSIKSRGSVQEDGKQAPAPAQPASSSAGKPPLSLRRPVRPFYLVAADQALDTVSDVWRHATRQLVPLPADIALDRLTGGSGGRLRLAKTKPVVLVLGSGWGAHSLIKVIDTDVYDVVLVSPRNHFLFTPMLPSTAVGTVEPRSLLEPIRTSNPFVNYFEATCDAVDTQRKVATCTSAFAYDDGRQPAFEVPYDILVVAVGEQPATFGVKGVKEHCFFMKEVTDTVALRNRIGECFELAALPGTTNEDRQRLLSFVVVGGGPTGVEFAGTLADFLRVDLRKKYPQLMKYVKVTLLQSSQTILTQFHTTLARRAVDNLASTGVEVRTGAGVTEVTNREVVLKGGDRLPYGVCVWSTGNATNPLVQDLASDIPEQAAAATGRGSRKLVVDPYLRVVGAQDMLALGDCATICDSALPATAQVAAQQGAYLAHLINRGYVVGLGGEQQPPPSRPVVKGPLGLPMPGLFMDLNAARLAQDSYGSMDSMDDEHHQAAAAGTSSALAARDHQVEYYPRPFEFLSLGIMAYVGNDKALTQIEAGQDSNVSLRLYGRLAFLLWRSVYITKQVSFRNRVLILFDWLKARVFGRDTSLF